MRAVSTFTSAGGVPDLLMLPDCVRLSFRDLSSAIVPRDSRGYLPRARR